MAASHDQHPRRDQLIAGVVGWPGVPTARLDSGSFGEDVVSAACDVGKLGDRLGQVAAFHADTPV